MLFQGKPICPQKKNSFSSLRHKAKVYAFHVSANVWQLTHTWGWWIVFSVHNSHFFPIPASGRSIKHLPPPLTSGFATELALTTETWGKPQGGNSKLHLSDCPSCAHWEQHALEQWVGCYLIWTLGWDGGAGPTPSCSLDSSLAKHGRDPAEPQLTLTATTEKSMLLIAATAFFWAVTIVEANIWNLSWKQILHSTVLSQFGHTKHRFLWVHNDTYQRSLTLLLSHNKSSLRSDIPTHMYTFSK